MFFKLTERSRNGKTGPMPVTTSDRATCPDSCAFKKAGCYAENFHLRNVWDKVTAGGLNAVTWAGLCEQIKALPKGTLWRHNQAGDLPGLNEVIDEPAMDLLIDANEDKDGFTFSHKPLTKDNLRIIRHANENGFTVNLSANNVAHADSMAKHNLPIAVVMPSDFGADGVHVAISPEGHKIAQCPATYRDDVTCKTCALCAKPKRKVWMGFPAHGNDKATADVTARG